MWVFYSELQGHVNGWFSGQSKDLPEATTALVWYQTYDPVYMLYCTIYLYCSFNYPVLPPFEVWSISFYLMPAEASTCMLGHPSPTFCLVIRALASREEAPIFNFFFFCIFFVFIVLLLFFPWINWLYFQGLNMLNRVPNFAGAPGSG